MDYVQGFAQHSVDIWTAFKCLSVVSYVEWMQEPEQCQYAGCLPREALCGLFLPNASECGLV